MPVEPLVLLVPSAAAALELPRRIAAAGRALAAVYPFTVHRLARAIAEPTLLGRGLRPWHAGHGALLARRLLAGEAWPATPVLSVALARTLSALRHAGAPRAALDRLVPEDPDDQQRVRTLGRLYRAWHDEIDGRFADTATILRAAADNIPSTRWLTGARVLVAQPLELEPLEQAFVDALVAHCPALDDRSLLDAVSGATSSVALRRLRDALFASAPTASDAGAGPSDDGTVELVTGAGEAAEARAIVRRILREAARGVPFEEMAVLLPRPDAYAELIADLLGHAGVPWRLHPSLPLRGGRAARSLLLLLRCRGLSRPAVMEFLTFAPVPFGEMLGPDATARPAQWDEISREAMIVAGFERWIIGLRSYAEGQRDLADATDGDRAARAGRRAADAEMLLRVVELLSGTLDALDGAASWAEWSARLGDAVAQWIGPEKDREALVETIVEMGGLGDVSGAVLVDRAEMQSVLESRLDQERQPLDPIDGGAVHLGAFDALAGVPFRFVAIPGLVEGGYPGVMRPDPFLLDDERQALARPAPARLAPPPRPAARGQLSLFDDAGPAPGDDDGAMAPVHLPTTQDRLQRARRDFQRACSQATERLVLSWPRADPRSGRERLPSLFLLAAASAVAGRPLSVAEVHARAVEDEPRTLELDDAVDAGERDVARIARGGAQAVATIALGSEFFRQAREASRRRWSSRLTGWDGLVTGLPPELLSRLDPVSGARPISASALGRWAQCGFQYLLKDVLRLDALDEPQERLGLDALEKGSLFHEVAETFLRERRLAGELPLTADPRLRARLHEIAKERVDALLLVRPPRFRMLWDMEWGAFLDLLDRWMQREIDYGGGARPIAFEVGFGVRRSAGEPAEQPHRDDPVEIDLGEGRVLRVSGRIDRIDERPDGTLVLRDYKTGRAPSGDGGLFRGGRQLQIPFYVIAALQMFPGRRVSEAFLDFVDGGRKVAFDVDAITGERLRELLRAMLACMAEGVYAQEPTACTFCDFVAACGPQPLLALRRRYKSSDPALQRALRVRDFR